MSIWDQPNMTPPVSNQRSMKPGDTATGTITALTVIDDAWGDGKSVLEVILDDRTIWANNSLWNELRSEAVEPGDRITIRRHDDKPIGGGKRVSVFTVTKEAGGQPKQPGW